MPARLPFAVLILSFASPAWPAADPPSCFTLTVESRFWTPGAGNSEDHHFQVSFRPPKPGDLGIYLVDKTLTCSVATMEPGDSRRFFLSGADGTGTARRDSQTHNAILKGVPESSKGEFATIYRKPRGAVLAFPVHSPIDPDGDDFFGVCPSNEWQPKAEFELREEELEQPGAVQKTLQLSIAPGNDMGCAGKATVTLNATLKPPDEEMLLEPGEGYDSWLPTPAAKDMPGIRYTASRPLSVKARIAPKKAGDETRKDRIDFTLEDVTRHSGRAGNFPHGGAEKDDLRFADKQPEGIVVEGKTAHTAEDVSEATVYIEATDFAAWGKIKASAAKLSLKAIYKPTNTYSLTIPRDDDGNRIADSWEGSARLEPGADDEQVAGQDVRGDGLTAASEYRGFVVLENGEKVFQRMDPKRKELFVVDAGGIFDTGVWERASSIVAWKLDESMIQGGSDRRQSRIVNFLPGPDRTHKFAVRLETMSGDNDPDDPKKEAGGLWGYTMEWPISSPKDAISCRVFKDRIRASINELYLWLGKALTVPGSPEEAELKASGYPRFLAQRALDQLGPAQVESLAGKIILVSAIHEVGHALGLPGHVNAKGEEDRIGPKTCPMRYLSQKNSKQLILLQILFAPDSPLPGEVSRFCSVEFDCFRKLNVKD